MIGREAIIGMMDGPRPLRCNASLAKDLRPLTNPHHLFLVLLPTILPLRDLALDPPPPTPLSLSRERREEPLTGDFEKLTGLCEDAIRERERERERQLVVARKYIGLFLSFLFIKAEL